MAVGEKIKTIDNGIEQNKAQYDLHRQTAEVSALSLGNTIKYEFLTGKDAFPEKGVLDLLGKELKTQTDIANKQYQKLDDIYEFDKMIKNEKQTFENIINQI